MTGDELAALIAAVRQAVREELAAAREWPALVNKADAQRYLGLGEQRFSHLVAIGPKNGGLPPGRDVRGYERPMWRLTDLEKWLGGLRPVRPATTGG